jgi:hypothetical protein
LIARRSCVVARATPWRSQGLEGARGVGSGQRAAIEIEIEIEIDEEFDVEILVNTPVVGRPSTLLQVSSLKNTLGE